ncbi:DUF2199 domain-containing protein [Streptomyces sp. SID11385]|uniref:DUF2199 domain-containing protein n=1 Tax=Streptomyces sp. SID11385 TaxID=2706031 RepID=UPI0013C82224|nr:DUF2199 domain-containing protein [Streptomyces sp. SID11385]NEA44510.1 DUF2199 domain-containing protein [Streptomyces sp. SID11385]
MTSAPGFICTTCGTPHAGMPLHHAAPAPHYWLPGMESAPGCLLSSDQCVINAEHYFVRGLIEIPVQGTDEVFSWGVWVSLSRTNFGRMSDRWDTPGREAEPSYFGWLSTELPAYSPTTLNLKTHVHTRPVGARPLVELEPTAHPLAVEQREGIGRDRVRELAAPKEPTEPPAH